MSVSAASAPQVRLGLGGWPFSGVAPRPDEAESISVIHRALDAGITLIDSADSYQLPDEPPGHNERLVAAALASHIGTPRVTVATKGGRAVAADGSRYCAAHPDRLRASCLASRERLGVETIDVYYLHRPDPAVPFEDSVGALVDLADAGVVSTLGVSNVNADQIRTAYAIAGDRLGYVQNEFSPWFRSSRSEIDVARELGLTFVAYAPFGGSDRSARLATDPAIVRAAASVELTPHEYVIAWMVNLADNVVPIPATRDPRRLAGMVAAAQTTLSKEAMDLFPRRE